MAKTRNTDRHASPRIALHLPQDLLDALDAWRARQRVEPGRSDAVRTLIREGLEREGLWPAQDPR